MKYSRYLDDSMIIFEVIPHGNDLHVSIMGGHAHHIGSVALSQNYPSLSNPEKVSASSSVITLCGHKEDQIARHIAETLSKHINGVVSVACGIHFNDANTQTIIDIRRITTELLNEFILDLS